jgi:hypothetical protein
LGVFVVCHFYKRSNRDVDFDGTRILDGTQMTRILGINADLFFNFFICDYLLNLRYLRAILWNADLADWRGFLLLSMEIGVVEFYFQ